MKTKLVRPILIESNIPTDLVICAVDDHLHKTEHYGSAMESIIGKDTYQQLIIISLEDEKIDDEDSVYDELRKCLWIKSDKIICNGDIYKKVIATQSQLSPEYIQQFIEEYNKGEEKDIRIEITNEPQSYKDLDKLVKGSIYLKTPKLTNGYVTIVNTMKAEEKLQQAANSHADNYYDKNDSEQFTHWCNRQSNFIAGAKSLESLEYWKEKEKLWTNEEMFELLNTFRKDFPLHRGIQIMDFDLKEWFNQHKK